MLLTALYFVVYAKWYMWHGGYSWGPRFLVPVIPFVSLVAGAGWDWLAVQRRRDTAPHDPELSPELGQYPGLIAMLGIFRSRGDPEEEGSRHGRKGRRRFS